MNDIESDIFTEIATKLRSEVGASNIYITGEYNPTPPKFPAVYFHESDNFNAGYDGCNTEVVTAVTYEAEVYSNLLNGKKSECKKLMKIIDQRMTSLGFRRTMLQTVPNMSDATIYRMIARYVASVIGNTIYRR